MIDLENIKQKIQPILEIMVLKKLAFLVQQPEEKLM